MFPDWDVPNTWFLTAAHNFEHHKIKFDYSFALQHPQVLNYYDHPIGSLIGVKKDLLLAIVEMNSFNRNDLKVTSNTYISCIRASGIDDFDIVTWKIKRDIYKSGAITGLTTGTLSSWGAEVNPSYYYITPGHWKPFIIVRKCNNKFSKEGDSGGSVFFINDNNEATIIGVVEGYWKFHPFWKLSAVTPYDLQKLRQWIEDLNDTSVSNGCYKFN